jgi:hypothetical protein
MVGRLEDGRKKESHIHPKSVVRPPNRVQARAELAPLLRPFAADPMPAYPVNP